MGRESEGIYLNHFTTFCELLKGHIICVGSALLVNNYCIEAKNIGSIPLSPLGIIKA
jgi:hypothetical protein